MCPMHVEYIHVTVLSNNERRIYILYYIIGKVPCKMVSQLMQYIMKPQVLLCNAALSGFYNRVKCNSCMLSDFDEMVCD